ncbi:hypothetical protein EUX98_g4589 [Antrodiella citrinella]|uniref:Aminopeptidase P N-terminal domain-containing protein n=1 Tax=Antrodiella citrinella TaxID=2447956 RepID=A0A4S4MTM0_9APHY|nr:hypothetical protein EUX98_g4589 [Antrodiella citrinella]
MANLSLLHTLISSNEVTPGISQQEYELRRRSLMDSLPDNSIVVAVGGQIKYMSGHIFYKFRQASDFWYLTGFEEPDSAVILEKNSSSRGYRMTLFSAGKDMAKEQWDGARTSFSDAVTHFKMDDAQPLSALSSLLKRQGNAASHIYMDILSLAGIPSRSEHIENLLDSIGGTKRQPLAPEVAKLRVIKTTIHKESAEMLQTELNKIGFNLRGSQGAGDLSRVLYPHYVGHPIGIDLHESNYHDRNGSLRSGMVITIEPGVYVPPHPSYPKHFHNMGIRIEDEVLVGKEHPVVLSVNAPKEIVDIEGACQGSIGLSPL